MRLPVRCFFALSLLGWAGCAATSPRSGTVEVGATPEAVLRAMGRPSATQGDPAHEATWIYLDPRRDDRDRVRAGFRRRVVFDPVRRSEVVITEPVDDRLAAALAPKDIRITFRDGRVASVAQVPEL